MILFHPAAIDSKSPERRGRTDAENAKYEFEIGHFKTKDEEHQIKVRIQTNYRNNLDRQLQKYSELDQRGDTYYEKGDFQIGADEKKVLEDKKRISHDFFLKNGEDIRIRDVTKYVACCLLLVACSNLPSRHTYPLPCPPLHKSL